jgi:site-specific recombinase XerD
VPFEIKDGFLVLEKSLRGWPLRRPVRVALETVLEAREKGLVEYVLQAFGSERSTLIPWVFENQSLLKLARHFLRRFSGSPMTLYTYADTLSRYSRYLGHNPDLILQDVKNGGTIPDQNRVQNHISFLEGYLAQLQDDGLSPGRVHGAVKHIRTWYRVNGIDIKLQEPLSRRIIYKDRSPTPEELTKLLELSDLRGKLVVSMLALGGFREDTLSKLEYRHVREDLENNRTPIRVHVEAELTKGKYHDYDTFLGTEATEYLRFYLDQRRKGSPDLPRNGAGVPRPMPPEKLTDSSPLIRDQTANIPRSVTRKAIRRIVRNLYVKAGLVKKSGGRMYELRVHSLRKYFRTQLASLGVNTDYIEYMMGHTVDTYHDIQSLGIEKLRGAYAAAGLGIRPKTRLTKIDAIKEMLRAMGENPERILSREALADGATTNLEPDDLQDHYLEVLGRKLREVVRGQATEPTEPMKAVQSP